MGVVCEFLRATDPDQESRFVGRIREGTVIGEVGEPSRADAREGLGSITWHRETPAPPAKFSKAPHEGDRERRKHKHQFQRLTRDGIDQG